jgi:hypothetical protein
MQENQLTAEVAENAEESTEVRLGALGDLGGYFFGWVGHRSRIGIKRTKRRHSPALRLIL